MCLRWLTTISMLITVLMTMDVISADNPDDALRITSLRCEYRDQPLGIDTSVPRLSWTMESDLRGKNQSAYRVLVASSAKVLEDNKGDLWDSSKVESAQSINVVYKGKPLLSGQRCYWKVKVWAEGDKKGKGSGWSKNSLWEMGLMDAADWQGRWIGDGKPLPKNDNEFFRDDPAPLFRKSFKLSRPIRSARLYISALGYYCASLNGGDVGDHKLDPLWTLPDKRIFYSVYDVTLQLSEGANCLGVTLGNGWYNPLPLRMWGRYNLRDALSVGRPQFIAQLNVEYADGSSESIVSDNSWKFTEGPVLRNSIYLGEKVDARKSVADWNKSGLNDSSWSPVHPVAAPEGRLQSQPLPAIKVTARIRPVRISEPVKGSYIVDMGQNFGGWARYKFNLPRGTTVTMRYGELLHKDGSLNPMTSVCGQIKNKPAVPDGEGPPSTAWQTDSYIAAGGGPEVYTPCFTFHAFRYIELTGVPSAPTLDDIEGLRMNSSVEPAGSFSCSNKLFNRIQKMCQWTFLSNIFGVQSDCPHRERFGYGGDLVTTSDAFMLNYDMAGFYAKVARDWHDSALPDGMLTDTAPFVGIQYCGVGWAMAHPHLQCQLYRYYGDRRIVEEQYAVSKRWFELVRAQNPDHIVSKGLHDHQALEKEKKPPMVTPLYCESARMLSRLARILGKEKDAAEYSHLSKEIKTAYVEKFIPKGTEVAASGIQSVQSFALFLDMLPAEERTAALNHLVADIGKHDGHLTTGIFGTRYMLDSLSREGKAGVVNSMVNKRDCPGWGYMLENGATTLWEHWKFSDNTYSHNHPMFGSVSQWFYNWLGGIEAAEDAVGFDKIMFHPQFVDGLDWVKCSHRSVRGPVTCNWKRDGSHVEIEIQVPVNSTAVLQLPAVKNVIESGKPAAEQRGVKIISGADRGVSCTLESGSYQFAFDLK